MPSKKEPWGVVLHEMAIVGLPLLVSDQVGAASMFLKSGANGFAFAPMEMKSAIQNFIQLPEAEIQNMGRLSHALGSKHHTMNWSVELFNLLEA